MIKGSGARVSCSNVSRKYERCLLMGLPGIKVSILAYCALSIEETALTVYSYIVG